MKDETVKEFPWEDKGIMVGHANRGETTKFYEFVHKHYKDFDIQAWSMFLECVSITDEELSSNLGIADEITAYFVDEIDLSDFRMSQCLRFGVLRGEVQRLKSISK